MFTFFLVVVVLFLQVVQCRYSSWPLVQVLVLPKEVAKGSKEGATDNNNNSHLGKMMHACSGG